jgi:predicted transposase/invertase (TIGR01784 family)
MPLLTDLINAVRSSEAPIEVVSIINPRINPENLHDKFIVLDILARDQHGHFLNVEMQMQQREEWSQRGVYYLAKTMAGQLKAGTPYAELKPVIGIHFLGYDLFPEPSQAIWCFEMRDRTRPSVRLGSELQLNVIELSKGARLATAGNLTAATDSAHTALTDWLTWFAHWKDEDIMNQIAHPAVIQAAQQLEALSANEEARLMADARELAMLTEYLEINAAEKRGEARGEARGIEIGEAIGEARGLAQAMQEAVKRLMGNGMSEAQAKSILGLD